MPSAAFFWQRISSSSPQAFTKANLILDALPSAHGDGERLGVDKGLVWMVSLNTGPAFQSSWCYP